MSLKGMLLSLMCVQTLLICRGGENQAQTDSVLASASAPATFEGRRQWLFEKVWTEYQKEAEKPSGQNAFFRAEALFELGKTGEGLRLVNRGLDLLVPGNKENRWIYGGNTGVNAWPGLDCYLRYGKYIDAATKQRYCDIYTGGAVYERLSTSNHTIMAAVSRYLATGIWGENSFHPNPFFKVKKPDDPWYIRDSQPNGYSPEKAMIFEAGDPTGEKYIRQRMEQMVKSGAGEYASRGYGAQNILPFLTLAGCAPDPEIRKRAALAYECSIIQLAPAYLRGHLATFAPRSYPDDENQSPTGLTSVLWLYFGGLPPKDVSEGWTWGWALGAATSDYRVPEILQPLGSDRAKPYVYRSLMSNWALYHFVNRSYALFSRSPKAAAKQFYGQSYPCGVMWDEPDPGKGSHLWITNPAADDVGQMKIHTHGVTSFEQEVQDHGSLLFVFNIPSGYRYPYALGYIPGGYRASFSGSNSMFLNYGSVLIAISSADPIDWHPEAGIRNPAEKNPRTGDSEFRVMASRTAIAIETALPAEFPGRTPEEQLEAFRALILQKSQIRIRSGTAPTGLYSDRNGNQLQCTFDGMDIINDTAVDYMHWPILDSPWTEQLLPAGPLKVVNGIQTRTYDFNDWSVK